jgi:hypothetical protein
MARSGSRHHRLALLSLGYIYRVVEPGGGVVRRSKSQHHRNPQPERLGVPAEGGARGGGCDMEYLICGAIES